MVESELLDALMLENPINSRAAAGLGGSTSSLDPLQ